MRTGAPLEKARITPATRIDQGCTIRRLREAFVARLAAVDGIATLPLDLDVQIREAAAGMLRDPRAYVPPDDACGGATPDATPSFEQRTFIGRFVR